MIDNETAKYINLAISAEQQAAQEEHGDLHSHHEALAVLKEEVEEAMENAKTFTTTTEVAIANLWRTVKYDCAENMLDEYLPLIKTGALELAQECVQVLAVCARWEHLAEERGEERGEKTE